MKKFPRPIDYAPCPWCGKQPEEWTQHAPSGMDGKTRAVDVHVSCRYSRCPVKPNGISIREPITGTETIDEQLRIAPGAWEAAILRARRKLAKAWNSRNTHAMVTWCRRRIEEQRAKPKRCWYCRKASPNKRIMVSRTRPYPAGQFCKTKMVDVHDSCHHESVRKAGNR